MGIRVGKVSYVHTLFFSIISRAIKEQSDIIKLCNYLEEKEDIVV